MIGKTVSYYKILEKLGGGGMGVVYKAEDTRLKRTVALKFLPPELTRDEEAKARFIQEAQAASSLDHANICTIHEIGETEEGQMFMCMAYYEGKTLKKKIGRGPLKLEEAVDIAIQCAQGLARAHEVGTVHRDIKPANLMITERGELRIVDFGLARLVGKARLTKTGMTVGTIGYMSPEQARGEEVDQRTDIWSLGIVLYEMLTGQLPFKGEYSEAVVYSILNEAPEPLTALRTGVPIELERIVGKALEKNPARRYQHMEDMLVDLKNLRDALVLEVGAAPKVGAISSRGAVSGTGARPVARGRLRRLLAPVAVLLVVAVALVVGIRIQIGRQPAAVAEENSLAVMYFDNLGDPEDAERLGEIATNLLILDLSESEYVQVVSSQRLYDVLKQLGMEGEKKIGREVATQVAEHAGARWMLLGSILRTEPQLEIGTQLVNVASGKVEASQRIQGEPGDEIFALVDRLTVEIKNDLSLPSAAQQEPDPVVAEVTTKSPKAYRHYLEGMENVYKMYWQEAEEDFSKALQYDSTFAMAYYQLAWAEREQGKGDGRELAAKAAQYSHNASQKEKHYIGFLEAMLSRDMETAFSEIESIVKRYPEEKDALYYLAVLHRNAGEFQKAEDCLEKVIKIDPLDKQSYNELSYLYDWMGDFEKSIWAINKYIELAPEEANPYDTRGELYANNGKLEQAIESYRKAVEIKPDFYTSVEMLGHLHSFKGDYREAERYYRTICSADDKSIRSWGRALLSVIPLRQGKLDEALKVLEDGIAADRMEQAQRYTASKHWLKATAYYQQKNMELMLKEARAASEVHQRVYPDSPIGRAPTLAFFLARCGRFEEAEELAKALEKEIAGEPMYVDSYWWVLGSIEQAKGNAEAAVDYLKKAQEAESSGPDLLYSYQLAQLYLDLGKHGRAVAELEQHLTRYTVRMAALPRVSVQMHYLLGLAYEKSGWTDKAIQQYEEFLDIWKDADPGIEEIEDAKTRLARLKAIS
jgi:tetratricopeptide (TPR) repeat protein/tRNA A-37 threonylcarbamoyl transferase component Bud32